jgi:hypothetical protein
MEARPMSILNRRNALVGWLAWTGAKYLMAQKARKAVPALDAGTRRPNKAAIVVALATLGIGAWLARHYTDRDGDDA